MGRERTRTRPSQDGTGALFGDFVRAAPDEVQLDVVALPQEPLGYAALAARLAPQLRLTADTILLAESFSGPLAIHIAQSQRLGAVVLCNTFVESPRPRVVAALPLTPCFRLRLPALLIRRFLVGPDAPDALVERVRATVASVPPSVLAARMASVLTVDVAASPARSTAPILYLRGTEDRIVREASVDAVVRAASSRVTVARIAGPHLLLQVKPEVAWRVIVDFLGEVE